MRQITMLMLALFGGVSLAAHGQTTPRPCPPTTPIAGETAMKPFAPGRSPVAPWACACRPRVASAPGALGLNCTRRKLVMRA